jgi:hypothetical protein
MAQTRLPFSISQNPFVCHSRNSLDYEKYRVSSEDMKGLLLGSAVRNDARDSQRAIHSGQEIIQVDTQNTRDDIG